MSNPPIPPDVAEIAAPMLLGALWNWTLDSSSGEDVHSYNFPGDRTLVKLLVYSVFLAETVQTALTGTDLYYWFVSGFGKMDHLISPYESPFDVPIIGSIVTLIVQFFFVYRIWVLSRRSSWFLCLLIYLFSIVAAGAAFYGGIYTHVRDKFASGRMLKVLALVGPLSPQPTFLRFANSDDPEQTWMSGNASADILIAGSSLFYLERRRREGSGHFSDHALSKVVRLIIETNVLTSTVGIVTLLTVAIFPDKTWFACPAAVLGKLYSNTLLVSLNNRISIREGRGAVVRSPPLTFALTTDSQPEPGSEIEFEKPSASGSSEDCTGRGTSRTIDICVTRDQIVV
ncbi:hypothetical protein EDB92DRAFT_1948015 [Lactarius akahatsu]|uniref:DUF6534 domain-containing protein n=1 Tax=Lactarius akahatsu TaxID=416441 RepID=A0AAD4LC10_9AGAM|nr:hypothetical protein EDB92DRAFT_1948015 [Lactarius akahatsu]